MKSSKIVLPEDNIPIQASFFGGVGLPPDLEVVPVVGRDQNSWNRVLNADVEYKGLDFEFNTSTKKASITGFCTRDQISCLPATKLQIQQLAEQCETKNVKLVGYSTIGAEKQIMDTALGRDTPLDWYEDGMLAHYLANSVLCKAPAKEEDDDSGALGFLNLWIAASMCIDTDQWKTCRLSWCDGNCPTHDVFGYCGEDAWAGLEVFHRNMEKLRRRGTSYAFYRELLEVTYICEKMSQAGVAVDRASVKTLDAQFEKKKDELFPFEMEGKSKVYKHFNPRSGEQVKEFFHKHGVVLENTDKDTVRKRLEKVAKERGFDPTALEEAEDLPEPLDSLYRLYQYKSSGKGFDSWFAQKYFGKDGFLHPRFITTGTSTGRLSSARPNCQNIPARGFGELIRKAIVPRNPNNDLLKADFCVAPGTKILKADLSWGNVEDLAVGEKLIGFPETLGGREHCFSPSEVTGTKQIVRPRYKVITDRGVILVANKHPFVVRRKKTTGGAAVRQWVVAEDLDIGDDLAFTMEPWQQNYSFEAGYISGILDGEGWCSTNVGFGQQTGSPVLERTLTILSDMGVNIGGGYDKDRVIVHNGREFKPVEKWCTSNTWEGMRLLGTVRPVRLLPKSTILWDGRRTWGKNTRSAKIIDIQYMGNGPVIALETSTATYISNGFLSHNSNLELRMAAYIGGMDPADIGADAFQFLVNNTPGEFERAAEWMDNGMSARDVAKSVAHANTNHESFLLLTGDDLARPNYKAMIEAGALRVYLPKLNPACKKEWTFRGKIVAFSGVNLAERLFGNKSYESRKKALQIQEDVFNANFPVVRQFHRKIMAEIENQAYIKNALGATLDIYGPDDEDCKIAASVQSQGNSAYFVQGVMLRLYRERGIIPNLQVHDELVVEVPKSMSDKDALEYMALMGAESQRLPGFRCAAKVKRGPNWGEMRQIGYV